MQGIEVWPNTEAAGSYSGEVHYLINWLTLHIAYLDSLFNSKAPTSATLGVSAGPMYSGSPVTLTAQVTGGAAPAGTVSFLASGILLGTSSLNSDGVASVTVSNLPPGTDSLQAVYSGDNANALSSSASQTVTVAAPPAGSVTNLADQGSSAGFFTASVIDTSGTAIPTGTVTFSMDLGPGAAMALDATGKARYYARPLTPGAHTIVASYSGDSNYSASSSAPNVFYTSQPPCRSCPTPIR
jgi:hypothetical protein